MYRLLLLSFVLVVAGNGCVSKNAYQQKVNQADLYSRDLAQLNNEKMALSTENSGLKKQLSELNHRLVDALNSNSKLQQDLLSGRADQQRQEQSFNQHTAEIIEQLAGLQQKKEQLLLNIDRLQLEISRQKETILVLEQQLEREDIASKARLASLKNRYDQLVAALEEEINQSEATIGSLEKAQEKQNSALVALQQDNSELSSTIAQLEETALQLRNQRAEQQAQGVDFTDVHQWLTAGLQKEIAAGKITITGQPDKLAMSLPSEAIFDTGQIDISAEGKLLLEQLGALLGTDYRLSIEGYVDNGPINSSLQPCYPTSRELSVGQAVRVAHFFQDEIGVPRRQLSVTGFGEIRPDIESKTSNEPARNNRIQINLLAD